MTQNIKYRLQIFDTPDKLYEASANLIIELAKKAIQERNRFTIALSGGHTPEKLYALLSQPEFSDQIEWKKVFVFWGDERCVPLNDKYNNAQMARSLLLDKTKIPVANIFSIPVNLPPAEAANEYENTVKKFFGETPAKFDLILLGLGANGHTASLFPNTAALHEQTHLVTEVFVEELKMYRITMTAPLINQSRQILFIATGKSKAEILEKVLHGPFQPDEYPAQLIKPLNGELIWYIDKEAATFILD